MLYHRDLGLVTKSDNRVEYVWDSDYPCEYLFLDARGLDLLSLFAGKVIDFYHHKARHVQQYTEKSRTGLTYKGVPVCYCDASMKSIGGRDIFCWGDYIICTYAVGFSTDYIWLLFDRGTYEFLGSMSRVAECINTGVFAKLIMVLKEIDFS